MSFDQILCFFRSWDDKNITVSEQSITMGEFTTLHSQGKVKEVFGCGFFTFIFYY